MRSKYFILIKLFKKLLYNIFMKAVILAGGYGTRFQRKL